jgi:hypothetical protein
LRLSKASRCEAASITCHSFCSFSQSIARIATIKSRIFAEAAGRDHDGADFVDCRHVRMADYLINSRGGAITPKPKVHFCRSLKRRKEVNY